MRHRRRFHHHRSHRRHHHHIRVALVIGNVAVELFPKWIGVTHMAFTLDAGKTENLAIEYLDINGSPMLVTPTPDSPPAWGQTNPAADTLTPSADGNTATALGLDAGGSDTIQLTVIVAGVTYQATVDATVNPGTPAQVLTSVRIAATPA
jgi:hypothetical protein